MKIAHLVSSKIFAGIEQHVYELSSFFGRVTEARFVLLLFVEADIVTIFLV